MREVHRRHTNDAGRAADELVEIQSDVDRLEGSMPSLEDKHRFYQDLRGYVTDLVDCYNEKVRRNEIAVESAYKDMRLGKMFVDVHYKRILLLMQLITYYWFSN